MGAPSFQFGEAQQLGAMKASVILLALFLGLPAYAQSALSTDVTQGKVSVLLREVPECQSAVATMTKPSSSTSGYRIAAFSCMAAAREYAKELHCERLAMLADPKDALTEAVMSSEAKTESAIEAQLGRFISDYDSDVRKRTPVLQRVLDFLASL